MTVEVRSVNNRYLNVKTKLPHRYFRHEADIEETVRGAVTRGTVDVHLRVRSSGREVPRVDVTLANDYVESIQALCRSTGLPFQLDVATVLQLPGVVTLDESDSVDDAELKTVLAALADALKSLARSRRSEGGRLRTEIDSHLDHVLKEVGAIATRTAKVPAAYKRKLEQRIRGLIENVPVDQGVLEREVAIVADRADVTEEVVRLRSHAAAIRTALAKKSGPIGRKLDFLVQELAREANTIGSKNQDVAIGRHVIDLKAWIERIREQVQNLE